MKPISNQPRQRAASRSIFQKIVQSWKKNCPETNATPTMSGGVMAGSVASQISDKAAATKPSSSVRISRTTALAHRLEEASWVLLLAGWTVWGGAFFVSCLAFSTAAQPLSTVPQAAMSAASAVMNWNTGCMILNTVVVLWARESSRRNGGNE